MDQDLFMKVLSSKNFSQVFHSCIAGLKIFIYGEYRSTKVNIFKLLLDNGLKMWLYNDYGY